MSEITINVELKTTPNQDGLRLVQIRITQNKKHKREPVKTDTNQFMRVATNQWSGEYGSWVKKNHPNYKSYNELIGFDLTKYGKASKKLTEENLIVSKSDVHEAVNTIILKQDFIAYLDKKMAGMKSFNNKKIYVTTKNKIIDCFGDAPFDFSDMTPAWLEKFDEYLREKNNLVSLSIYMKKIKRLWNMAMSKKEQVVNKELYPFGKVEDGKYQIPSTKKLKKQLERLTETEIKSLFKCQYNNSDVYDTVDLKFYAQKAFLLSFLCAGIRIEDLLCLKWSNEKQDEFVYIMSKGVAKGKEKKFGINPQLKQILDDLRPENYKKDDFILTRASGTLLYLIFCAIK
ncbi:MAG: site-specific integrase [Bacteroidota bacterium]